MRTINPFKRSKRLSDRIAAVEKSIDTTFARLGEWMDQREFELRDRQITRKAIKARKQLDETLAIMQRMAELDNVSR